jgi:hypothetical protein
MAMLAMWFLETDAISSGNAKLLMIFIGLVALAMVSQAVVQIAFSIKATKAIKGLVETVEEFKEKTLPLIDSARQIGLTTQSLISDAAPKVKAITDNLLETSEAVRGSAQRFDRTFADANVRAQRQVARVDGMVTAALTATVEVVETINQGVRVPARKVAMMATQAKFAFEGLLARLKARAAAPRSGDR